MGPKWHCPSAPAILCFVALSVSIVRAPNSTDRLSKPGDYILGGLFTLTTGSKSVPRFGEALNVQAMIYAIEMINNNSNVLSNVTLGYDIVDDKDNIDNGVKFAMRLMMGETALERRKWIERQLDNDKIGFQTRCEPSAKRMVATIGPLTSDVAIAVNSVLSTSLTPQISYSATSPALSAKEAYPSFLRTTASDEVVAEALAEMAHQAKWQYLTVFTVGNMYGQTIVPVIRNTLGDKGICISTVITIHLPLDPEQIIDSVVSTAERFPAVNVFVLAVSETYVDEFFEIAASNTSASRIVREKLWLIIDLFGISTTRGINETSKVPVGAIGFEPEVTEPAIFYLYLTTAVKTDQLKWKNPWLWESLKVNFPGHEIADPELQPAIFKYLNRTAPVISATYSAAFALEQVILSGKTVCPENVLSQLFLYGYANVKSYNHPGVELGHFDPKGNVLGNLNVKNYKTIGQDGPRIFAKVGSFYARKLGEKKKFQMDWGSVTYPDQFKGVRPFSVCHTPCQKGTYMVYTGEDCCFTCFKCEAGYYSNSTDSSKCSHCPPLMTNNSDHSGCVFKNQFDPLHPYQIGVYATIGVCLSSAIITWILFIRHIATPVFVCSNVRLTTVVLVCVTLTICFPLTQLGNLTEAYCIGTAQLYTLLFSAIVSALLVKTWNILRVFQMRTLAVQRDSVFRNHKELIQWGALSIAGCVLEIPYAIVHPPQIPADGISCGTNGSNLQLIGSIYVMLLLLVAAFFAFKGRNLPYNYNETQYISITAFTIILVWILTVQANYIPSPNIRNLVLGISIELISTAVLVLFFWHKFWIIYMRPERNTLAYVRQQNALHAWNSSHQRLGRRQRSTINSLLGLKRKDIQIKFKAKWRLRKHDIPNEQLRMTGYHVTSDQALSIVADVRGLIVPVATPPLLRPPALW